MLSDRIKGALLGAGMSEGHLAALAAAGYDEDEVFEAMADRGAEALARHAGCAPGAAEKALLRLRPPTDAQVRGWSAAKLAAAAAEAARAGEVDWRGAVAARVFALTGGVVPRGMDPAVLERFLAYQMATEARGRVAPYAAPSFDGVPLVPWAEAARRPEEGPLRDPFTGEVLDAAGHNPARDRDFPVGDAVAMDAIGYFAARALKLDPNDEDDVHQAVHAALAAVACARSAKDGGDLRSLIRGSAQIRPSMRTIAQKVASLVLAPDHANASGAAEVQRVARARLRAPAAVDEVEAQRRGRSYKDVERWTAGLENDGYRVAPVLGEPVRAEPVPATGGSAEKFFVVAARDAKHASYVRELREHLAISVHMGRLSVTSVFECPPGANVAAYFERSLTEADVVVVLVSSATASECVAEVERACTAGKRVVPVLVGACVVPECLRSRVALPQCGKPVASYADRDDAWAQVAVALAAIAER